MLVETTARNLGIQELPVAVVAHPLGGLKREEVIRKADNIVEDVISKLCEAP
jgi:hypothetical protein